MKPANECADAQSPGMLSEREGGREGGWEGGYSLTDRVKVLFADCWIRDAQTRMRPVAPSRGVRCRFMHKQPLDDINLARFVGAGGQPRAFLTSARILLRFQEEASGCINGVSLTQLAEKLAPGLLVDGRQYICTSYRAG